MFLLSLTECGDLGTIATAGSATKHTPMRFGSIEEPKRAAIARAGFQQTRIFFGDQIFPAEGAQAYLRDLPKAELHLLDSGHFALEDQGAEIASLMLSFLNRNLATW